MAEIAANEARIALEKMPNEPPREKPAEKKSDKPGKNQGEKTGDKPGGDSTSAPLNTAKSVSAPKDTNTGKGEWRAGSWLSSMIGIDQPPKPRASSARNKKTRHNIWGRFDGFASRLSRGRLRILMALALIAFISILASFLIFWLSDGSGSTRFIFGLLMLLITASVICFGALVLPGIIRERMKITSPSPTQRRLATIFVLMALVPTLIVAGFSSVTLYSGFEGWFSERVRAVVDHSYSAAKAYSREHFELLSKDGEAIHSDIVHNIQEARRRELYTGGEIPIGNLREFLTNAIDASANISAGFVIDGRGAIIARGPHSYRFDYLPPTKVQLERAIGGEVVVIEDRANHEFRYLRPLDIGLNHYLYVTRRVDGGILLLLDETEETAEFYRNLERNRQRFLITYTFAFIIAALFVLLFAIWMATYFSRRLTRPISQLVRAVARMKRGELNVRVPESDDRDEFAILSRSFNEMTDEVRNQQDALRAAGEASEHERQRFNSVLAGVSSGVVGIDAQGLVTFINPAAIRILRLSTPVEGTRLEDIAPEFASSIIRARATPSEIFQEQITIFRAGRQEHLFVRINHREGAEKPPATSRDDAMGDLIIAFDDASELIQAQRMAAWGDVARRIAHEIKNPLTPIRLSAERIKLAAKGGSPEKAREGGKKFGELTEIIIRQTDDLKRIVDEFSRFSRMPEPVREAGNWIDPIKEAIKLHATLENVEIHYEGPEFAGGHFDASLFRQALINLIKNALEAIETRRTHMLALAQGAKNAAPLQGRIDIRAREIEGEKLQITILDNGVGFGADKSRLFEPYITNKEAGTGLGLSITRKIVEDLGGKIALLDREDGSRGAAVQLAFAITNAKRDEEMYA